LRIKEQETRLTLQEHDDDDDEFFGDLKMPPPVKVYHCFEGNTFPSTIGHH